MNSRTVFSFRSHRFAAAALAFAVVLVLSQAALGQSTAPAESGAGLVAGAPHGMPLAQKSEPGKKAVDGAAMAVAKEEGAPKPAEGLAQGMKVHGHWIIDVKNADGTLAHHHEFENSLQYDGQQLLTALLSGYAVMGGWEIYFTSQSGGTSPCTGGPYPFCAIAQSTTTQPGLFACGIYTCVGGLTVTPTFGVGPTIRMTGSMTAPNAGTIGYVGTGFGGCSKAGEATGFPTSVATMTPQACQAATTTAMGGTATATNVAVPIAVASGQIIQVTVVLSFS